VSDLPAPVDAEVAAATFAAHLGDFFSNGRPTRDEAWALVQLDPLHAVIIVPARRPDGGVDPYFLRLGAEYYDLWPPLAEFVEPGEGGTWVPAGPTSAWWPRQGNAAEFQFALHNPYQYPDGRLGQLLCFSHSLGYYLSGHVPQPGERWVQGTHTVSATLTRVADALVAPNYQGRSNDHDS
jgi:hypothetical protein